MSVDNPYYFYNDKSPKTPDSSSKSFSFFKRRNSKGSTSSNSNTKLSTTPQKSRQFNSATLSSDISILGSPRGSLGSLGSYPGTICLQEFEINPNNFNTGTLKRTDFEKYRQRLGSYNESICYSENDDVFMPAPSRHVISRTLPNTSKGVRRHSVGNFTNRFRGGTSSISDEVPRMVAPKPPIISPSKYRNDFRRENCRNSSMDDILVITAKNSERGILWANFLKNRFDKITKQRGRKPFNFLHVKIDEGKISTDFSQKCLSTALQIVILCPALMAYSHQFLMSQLSAILNPEKVLGILLEVSEDKVLEIHKAAFPSFRKWKRCTVRDNDQSVIGNVLGIATDILGRALCQRPPCQEINGNNPLKMNTAEEFTVVPRKVKIGQNKVLALLNDPLTKDDWIKITIEKSGEIIDVNNFKKRNPYTLQFNIPETCMEISTMIEIRIEKNERNLGCRPIKCESRLRELEQLLRTQDSPIEFMCHSLGIGSTERDLLDLHLLQCFQKNIPQNFHLLNGPFDKQNHLILGKESRPEEYPTLLHFAAKWGFERLCIQLLECPGGDAASEIKNNIGKIPADIAEQEGFHKLAKSLKSFSQMHEFTTMYHYFKGISDTTATSKVMIEPKQDLLPKKMFEKQISQDSTSEKDFNKLRTQTDYMEMSSGSEGESTRPTTKTSKTPLAVTNLNYINIDSEDDCNLQKKSDELIKNLDKIKIMPDTEIMTNELRINEPPYYQSNEINNKPDQFSQECSKVLENCNTTISTLSSQMDYILQPSNIPVNQMNNNNNNNNDYMTHPSNRPVEIMANYMNEPLPPNIRNVDDNHHYHQHHHDDSHLRMIFEKKKTIDAKSKNGTLKRNGSDASSSRNNVDEELAEIMYDFKNNVLTIKEVEELVEKWKNRNDVKQSFKEKQEHIEKLREEYERIREQMQVRLKRPTPFERVKKLFSRSKSHTKSHSEDLDLDTKSSVVSFQSSSQRPISSLSLQSLTSSSSSSGRMSTGSACSGASLGDSGTHSDHEDRRQSYITNCRIGQAGSLMDNYLIPPPPRPVIITPVTTPTDEKERLLFTTNHNNRSTTPTSCSSPTEHYIIFPSNVPVFQQTTATIPDNHTADSLQFCGLNTIVETKETPAESNSVTVQSIKVQSNDIIYSEIKRKNDVCSSFKPIPIINNNNNNTNNNNINNNNLKEPPIISNNEQIKNIKKEMTELYQNINGLANKTATNDSNKVPTNNNINNINNNNNNLEVFNNTENENHNYMNV